LVCACLRSTLVPYTTLFRSIPAEILIRMGTALKHRGPDDSGVFYDDSSGVGLVHRRLSILDLSPAGHQPMTSHSDRYVIIFNGEVYNFEEDRKSTRLNSSHGSISY